MMVPIPESIPVLDHHTPIGDMIPFFLEVDLESSIYEISGIIRTLAPLHWLQQRHRPILTQKPIGGWVEK